MAEAVKQQDNKNRKSFHTTLDKDLVYKMQMLKIILKIEGIDKDGYNELLEEGMEMVLDKYKDEYNIDVNRQNIM